MSLTIDVSPETVRRIEEAARLSSTSVQEFLRRLVEQAVTGNGESSAGSGADLVRAWQRAGVIGAWRGRPEAADSVALADKLRRDAENRTHD